RSARTASFRAADDRRDRPGARHQGSDRGQTLHPGAETAQRDPLTHAGWHGGILAMSTSSSAPDPLNPLAEEFVARYRRGEHPSLTEYTAQHPELADEIRELF